MNTTTDNTQDPMDAAINWLAINRGGDPNRDQHEAFLRWLNRHEENAQAYHLAHSLWLSPEIEQAATRLEAMQPEKKSFEEATFQPEQPTASAPHRWGRGFYGIAATVAVLILSVVLKHSLKSDFSSSIGERRDLAFSDGSEIKLNSNSEINTSITDTGRSIELIKGEAFFQVASDKSRPFTVQVSDTTVTVTGTAFSVRRYSDKVRVSVQEGRVEVQANNGPAETLGAGDSGTSFENMKEIELSKVSSTEFAWLRNRLVFHDQPMSTVVEEIKRYHSGVILLVGDDLRNARVSGNFSLDDPTSTLQTLAQINDFELLRLSRYLLIIR